MTQPTITNRRILVITKNHYRYRGVCVHEDQGFIHIDDERSGRLTLLAKSEIGSIEILEANSQ